MSGPDLAGRYREVLESYLTGEGEQALHAAHELGRDALEVGVGPLVLFSIHRDVASTFTESAIDPVSLTRDATAVFIETLAPFQMAYAGLDEARGAVAELGALMQGHADDLDTLAVQLDDAPRIADTVRKVRKTINRHLGELRLLRGRIERVQQAADARRKQISEIVTVQEQERRRIADEIHDDALQAMAAVLIRLGMVSRNVTDPAQQAVMRELEMSAREAIKRLRRLLAGLQPPELDRSGLISAVTSALDLMEHDFAISYTLNDALANEPGPEARTVAFRIIQEALANSRKHSRGSHVDVELRGHDEGILVRVVDNGVGFDVHAASDHAEPGHLGLGAMRERATLAGGWLTIKASLNGADPSDGTTVEFWIPGAPAPPSEA